MSKELHQNQLRECRKARQEAVQKLTATNYSSSMENDSSGDEDFKQEISQRKQREEYSQQFQGSLNWENVYDIIEGSSVPEISEVNWYLDEQYPLKRRKRNTLDDRSRKGEEYFKAMELKRRIIGQCTGLLEEGFEGQIVTEDCFDEDEETKSTRNTNLENGKNSAVTNSQVDSSFTEHFHSKEIASKRSFGYSTNTNAFITANNDGLDQGGNNKESVSGNHSIHSGIAAKLEQNQIIDVPIAWLGNLKSSLDKEDDPPSDNYCKWEDCAWINADLRYFPLSCIGNDFDVVLIDPPWRIRGQDNTTNERTMFSNSEFSLQYNTLSNQEIIDIDVGALSSCGFCFLWVIKSQLPLAFECLNKWGYIYVDMITWVKKTSVNNLAIGQGWYFLHSTELCLVGMKCASGNTLQFISKVNNDIIFAPVEKKSKKPEQLYHLIEMMVPGGKYIELFARNHNIRKGWLSVGNQLGEYFDWDHDQVCCDECHNVIEINHPRFKYKLSKNRDLCEVCMKKMKVSEEEYFRLENEIDEMVFHEWYKCNLCNSDPLWGIRFHCLNCPDLDICEECYDDKRNELVGAEGHDDSHQWMTIETPEFAGGFNVHRVNCAGCNTNPIIGYLFTCVECSQKCFFLKKEPRKHIANHSIDLVLDTDKIQAWIKCEVCGTKPIVGPRYKCQSCFNYDICQKCYLDNEPPPKNNVSHKPFHKFTKILGNTLVNIEKKGILNKK